MRYRSAKELTQPRSTDGILEDNPRTATGAQEGVAEHQRTAGGNQVKTGVVLKKDLETEIVGN